MADFLHIFIKPRKGISEEHVKEKMDLAVDWYKYSDNNWVVKTSSDIQTWFSRLKNFVEVVEDDKGNLMDGTLVILKIDPQVRHGWVSKGFWTWLDKASGRIPSTPDDPDF